MKLKRMRMNVVRGRSYENILHENFSTKVLLHENFWIYGITVTACWQIQMTTSYRMQRWHILGYLTIAVVWTSLLWNVCMIIELYAIK